MATSMGIKNQLGHAKYEHIATEHGKGMSFCGWGVRERGGDFTQGKTILCQNWGADHGSAIEWIRICTGTCPGPGVGDIVLTFWQQSILGGDFLNRGTVTFDETDVGGAWAADTFYTFHLDTPIVFASVIVSNCYISVYTSSDDVQISSSTTAGADARQTNGDVSGDPMYDWDAGVGVSSVSTAISVEAFSAAVDYANTQAGGTMVHETTFWQNGLACTATGWDTGVNPDDPTGIYGAGFAFSAGGNGSEILIDLCKGILFISQYIPHISGYPGSNFGVYPVSSIDISFTLNNPGVDSILSVQYNDDDGVVAPLGGWEELWRDSATIGAHTEAIDIPVVARWLKIEQVGANLLDSVSDFNVNVFELEVTDGKFYVDANDEAHLVWLQEYPAADALFKFQLKNKAGSGSDWSDPISNRRMKD